MSEPQCSITATKPPTIPAAGERPSPKIPMALSSPQSNNEPKIADKSAVIRRPATRPISRETAFWLDIRNLHDISVFTGVPALSFSRLQQQQRPARQFESCGHYSLQINAGYWATTGAVQSATPAS